MSHTPTPWKVSRTADGYAYLSSQTWGNFARVVVAMDDGTPCPGNDALIVERVNGWDALKAERDALREGVKRLASMEAFGMARAISPEQDAELLARIDFARALLEAK